MEKLTGDTYIRLALNHKMQCLSLYMLFSHKDGRHFAIHRSMARTEEIMLVK
jgi:hypothetical protein